ncbi:hypothetical protein [Pedobacter zeae]|nr:hypothetical protein [Pedobacter zeae]
MKRTFLPQLRPVGDGLVKDYPELSREVARFERVGDVNPRVAKLIEPHL